ncbi:TPA: hypothetical protein JRX32_001140 [Elizabethkingia anophelis]|uniref:bacteriocin-like protein n=1 Tax=Elizabethkingia anophelis TaxID=1117645 RepID=UPI0016278ECD|nr:hypothetical protein [Elizabethkingia anophelis]MCT4322173.1 hypothetical protein [Elizabethkingia anophelis]HAY3534538.1 hypothetical protein [Elizabethkingia anophelis]HAY3546654.1 hypothetical protein [Elizabethkingia anophelis]HAY3591442.1 hypothetical protein [Elizabethkingia anophelis]
MKNLKKLSRENLRLVSGGLRSCMDGCGLGECCSKGVCRSGPNTGPRPYLCDPPIIE